MFATFSVLNVVMVQHRTMCIFHRIDCPDSVGFYTIAELDVDLSHLNRAA